MLPPPWAAVMLLPPRAAVMLLPPQAAVMLLPPWSAALLLPPWIAWLVGEARLPLAMSYPGIERRACTGRCPFLAVAGAVARPLFSSRLPGPVGGGGGMGGRWVEGGHVVVAVAEAVALPSLTGLLTADMAPDMAQQQHGTHEYMTYGT